MLLNYNEAHKRKYGVERWGGDKNKNQLPFNTQKMKILILMKKTQDFGTGEGGWRGVEHPMQEISELVNESP